MIGSSISIDGTKIKANASSRQSKNSDSLEKEIDRILKESIETDKYEDEIYGDSTPYQIPEELVDKKKRLEKIKNAKKKLDEERGIRKTGIEFVMICTVHNGNQLNTNIQIPIP
ncbi:Mobile element protein [Methanosarcina mazei Tuc01]|uniref:Mobile element protein n=1 Tax=Methanosarcina mazei Tuc01 TaxID=1236903 RepID=M1Q5G7_METMZ|nr:Mobile element protein [Methanosarcina mazei Tuc01]